MKVSILSFEGTEKELRAALRAFRDMGVHPNLQLQPEEPSEAPEPPLEGRLVENGMLRPKVVEAIVREASERERRVVRVLLDLGEATGDQLRARLEMEKPEFRGVMASLSNRVRRATGRTRPHLLRRAPSPAGVRYKVHPELQPAVRRTLQAAR